MRFVHLVDEQLQKTTNNVKARYRRKGLRKLSIEQDSWPPVHVTSFANLALIHQKVKQLQAKEDVSKIARMRSAGNIDEIPESTSSIKLDNIHQIFTPVSSDSQTPMSILIEGHPGIGKSTLCKEICMQWANNNLLKSDKLVILLMLRDPRVQDISNTEEVMKYALPPDLVHPVVSCLNSTNGDDITFIIDGFDELSSTLRRASFFRNLIEGDILPNSRIVVTSRPFASACLHQYVDRRIEILGFDKSNKEKYVNDALISYPSKLEALREHFLQYPNIDAMCYIPLNMAIIVHLCLVGPLPSTATEMYQSFILHIVCRHLQREKQISVDSSINKIEQFPPEVIAALQQLAAVAFSGLVEDKLVFTMNDLPEACRNNPTFYGLLQSVECYCSEEIGSATLSLNFLHLGMQEYFAAKFVSTLPQHQVYTLMRKSFLCNNTETEMYFMFSDTNSMSVRLFNMWILYCGITGGQCDSLKRYLSECQPCLDTDSYYDSYDCVELYCEYLSDLDDDYDFCFHLDDNIYSTSKRSKPQFISQNILKDQMNISHLFQCFQEAKDDTMCKTLSESFSGSFNSRRLLPHEVVSLGYLLSQSPNKMTELNLRGCHIGDHGFKLLHHCLNYWKVKEIAQLNFSYNDLTGASSTLISDVINHLRPVILILSFNNITGLNNFCPALTTVKNLVIIGNNLTSQEAPAISDRMKILEDLQISRNRLGDEGAKWLSSGIKASSTLTNLDIQDNDIGDTGAKAIAYSLIQNTSLKKLCMNRNVIGCCGATEIGIALTKNSTLQRIDIDSNKIGKSGAMAIAESLLHNTSLKALYMNDNSVGQDGAIAIADSVLHNTSLVILDLCNNGIGLHGTKKILRAIAKNNVLQKLLISNNRLESEVKVMETKDTPNDYKENTSLEVLNVSCSIDQDGALLIANSLIENSALRVLDMSDNAIGTDGAKAIANSLAMNSSLEVLNMNNNSITQNGAIAIADYLAKNASLEMLKIDGNCIGSVGARAIANSLEQNTTLNILCMNDNAICPNGATAVAEMIQKNTSLEFLDISNNSIDDSGTTQIANSLTHNASLWELHMNNNFIGKDGAKAIAANLSNNRKLRSLAIADNSEIDEESVILMIRNNIALRELQLSSSLLYNYKIRKEAASINNERLKSKSSAKKLENHLPPLRIISKRH